MAYNTNSMIDREFKDPSPAYNAIFMETIGPQIKQVLKGLRYCNYSTTLEERSVLDAMYGKSITYVPTKQTENPVLTYVTQDLVSKTFTEVKRHASVLLFGFPLKEFQSYKRQIGEFTYCMINNRSLNLSYMYDQDKIFARRNIGCNNELKRNYCKDFLNYFENNNSNTFLGFNDLHRIHVDAIWLAPHTLFTFSPEEILTMIEATGARQVYFTEIFCHEMIYASEFQSEVFEVQFKKTENVSISEKISWNDPERINTSYIKKMITMTNINGFGLAHVYKYNNFLRWHQYSHFKVRSSSAVMHVTSNMENFVQANIFMISYGIYSAIRPTFLSTHYVRLFNVEEYFKNPSEPQFFYVNKDKFSKLIDFIVKLRNETWGPSQIVSYAGGLKHRVTIMGTEIQKEWKISGLDFYKLVNFVIVYSALIREDIFRMMSETLMMVKSGEPKADSWLVAVMKKIKRSFNTVSLLQTFHDLMYPKQNMVYDYNFKVMKKREETFKLKIKPTDENFDELFRSFRSYLPPLYFTNQKRPTRHLNNSGLKLAEILKWMGLAPKDFDLYIDICAYPGGALHMMKSNGYDGESIITSYKYGLKLDSCVPMHNVHDLTNLGLHDITDPATRFNISRLIEEKWNDPTLPKLYYADGRFCPNLQEDKQEEYMWEFEFEIYKNVFKVDFRSVAIIKIIGFTNRTYTFLQNVIEFLAKKNAFLREIDSELSWFMELFRPDSSPKLSLEYYMIIYPDYASHQLPSLFEQWFSLKEELCSYLMDEKYLELQLPLAEKTIVFEYDEIHDSAQDPIIDNESSENSEEPEYSSDMSTWGQALSQEFEEDLIPSNIVPQHSGVENPPCNFISFTDSDKHHDTISDGKKKELETKLHFESLNNLPANCSEFVVNEFKPSAPVTISSSIEEEEDKKSGKVEISWWGNPEETKIPESVRQDSSSPAKYETQPVDPFKERSVSIDQAIEILDAKNLPVSQKMDAISNIITGLGITDEKPTAFAPELEPPSRDIRKKIQEMHSGNFHFAHQVNQKLHSGFKTEGMTKIRPVKTFQMGRLYEVRCGNCKNYLGEFEQCWRDKKGDLYIQLKHFDDEISSKNLYPESYLDPFIIKNSELEKFKEFRLEFGTEVAAARGLLHYRLLRNTNGRGINANAFKKEKEDSTGFSWPMARQLLEQYLNYFRESSMVNTLESGEANWWQDLHKSIKPNIEAILNGPPFDFSNLNVQIWDMAAGAGKTTTIVESFDPYHDLYISPLSALRGEFSDTVKKKHGLNEVSAKTYEVVMSEKVKFFDKVFVDEAFLVPIHYIITIFCMFPSAQIILVGDSQQCGYMEKFGNMPANSALKNYMHLFPNSKKSRNTFRVSENVCKFLRESPFTKYEINSVAKHQTKVTYHPYRDMVNFDVMKSADLNLVFSKRAYNFIAELNSTGLKTVRSSQGLSKDRVNLFVSSMDSTYLLHNAELMIVAFTRAKFELNIYEIDQLPPKHLQWDLHTFMTMTELVMQQVVQPVVEIPTIQITGKEEPKLMLRGNFPADLPQIFQPTAVDLNMEATHVKKPEVPLKRPVSIKTDVLPDIKTKVVKRFNHKLHGKPEFVSSIHQDLRTILGRMTSKESTKIYRLPKLSNYQAQWDKFKRMFLKEDVELEQEVSTLWTEVTDLTNKYCQKGSFGKIETAWEDMVGVAREHLKQQMKIKNEEAPLTGKGGQPVVSWEEMARPFQTFFRKVEHILIKSFNERTLWANKESDAELQKKLRTVLRAAQYILENDMSEYDSRQNEFTRDVEIEFFGMVFRNDALLNMYRMFRTDIPVVGKAIFLKNDAQKSSGEPATLLGNTVLNMFIMTLLISEKAYTGGAFKGDDSIVGVKNDFISIKLEVERGKGSVSKFFPVQFKDKLYPYDDNHVAEFCKILIQPEAAVYDLYNTTLSLCTRSHDESTHDAYRQSIKDRLELIDITNEKQFAIIAQAHGMSLTETKNMIAALEGFTKLEWKEMKNLLVEVEVPIDEMNIG